MGVIPSTFGEEFLSWFEAATERAWAGYETREFDDYVAAGIGGLDWQKGTRWIGGITETQIVRIEETWKLKFPPDYRLFLRKLFATDRPQTGALFLSGDTLDPVERPGFYDWHRDGTYIRTTLDNVIEGILFDVENNRLWLESWETRPETAEERKLRVSKILATYPRLIPVFAHRCLVAEPCRSGNPILSIHQSDIIIYGGDLRAYLLTEFSRLLELDPKEMGPSPRFDKIQGWGELIG